MRGLFIAIEGSDGSGKTSVIEILKEKFSKTDIDVVFSREPGGTKIGEHIRNILLGFDGVMSFECEALLFAAARAQHVNELIKPSINDGKLVICDRFIMSSIAYQGYGRELGADDILAINDFGIHNLRPDKTIFLDVDPLTVLKRKKENFKADRLEKESNSFHQLTYEGYKELRDSEEFNVEIVDASLKLEDVANEVYNKIMFYWENRNEIVSVHSS